MNEFHQDAEVDISLHQQHKCTVNSIYGGAIGVHKCMFKSIYWVAQMYMLTLTIGVLLGCYWGAQMYF
jgi:hypothetical protein